MEGTGGPSVEPERPVGDGSRPSVVAKGLSKTYGDGTIGAQDISLEAAQGEVVGILGPNGAGKSTTLNMLATLIAPTSGEASICGHSLEDARAIRPLIGVALQSVGLDPMMTGAQHFELQGAMYRLPTDTRKAREGELAASFGLEGLLDHPAGVYSGGVQRRLSLSLALLHDPPVVIFDEPTVGLDLQSRRSLWGTIRRLREAGRTIIMSTQYLEEADTLCDRIYVINDGTVAAQGTPSELRAMVGSTVLRVRVRFGIENVQRTLAEAVPDLRNGRIEDGVLVYDGDGQEHQVPAVARALKDAGIDALEISVGAPSLDEAFIRLTGQAVRTEPLLRRSGDIATAAPRG